jgi:leucyl aminopeptidase
MISLVTSLSKNTAHTLLLEIIDTEAISFYKNLGIAPDILEKLETNLKEKKNPEKTMKFYGDFFGAKVLVAFFPKKESLTDDRSDCLRHAHKNTLFIPVREFSSAYEVFTLATYTYDRFLTKKEEKNHTLLVPATEKKSLEAETPLLEAIIRARDIINQPPTDTRPEVFVEYIESFQWKHFKLRIIDAKELKKLGCNLLLAV